jgi:CHAD domain-containing protein
VVEIMPEHSEVGFSLSSTTVLDPARARYLPAVTGDSFLLGPDEPLGEGLQRLSLGQLEEAIAGFVDPASNIEDAIHRARKASKRLRAILRLVRPEIGERVYRFENRALRDAARLVSGVRDAAVAVETVRLLADRFDGSLPLDVFDDLSERLDRRYLRIRQRIVEESRAIADVVAVLERSRARFAGWPTGEAAKKVYGSAIRDRFDAVGPGLGQTYARGRREMKQAMTRPTAVDFHLWRKRVKYLRYQTEILRSVWPEVVGGAASTLVLLSEHLGQEHDLAELLSLLAVDSQLCPDPVERSLFAALAQHRRAELQAGSRVLGMRVYAEKSSQFVGRLGVYWKSNRLSTGVGIVADV